MSGNGRALVIAEAGVNHNGSIDLACELVDAAADAGADIVKFQTFSADALVTPDAPKAAYQLETTDRGQTQYEMLKALELKASDYRRLVERCRARGIGFLSTPFDPASLAFLVDELAIDRVKIPSGEITNGPMLLAAARTRLPVILSTGMSTLEDVREALAVLAFGYDRRDETPGREAFERAYVSQSGRDALRERVTLLHCTTSYPAPLATINLRAMDTMRDAFGLPVGYSDHSQGIVVPIAAVARGAVVIEKHFTMDRTLPGPDHLASLEPAELKSMVSAIRDVETALGSAQKLPTAGELETCKVVRKSLSAARPIAPGEAFTEENMMPRRPGSGISPMEFWDILGSTAGRAYRTNDLIER